MNLKDKKRIWVWLFVLPLLLILSLPAWYFGSSVLISLFSLVVVSVIQPILSIYLVSSLVHTKKQTFQMAAILVLVANTCAVGIHYLNWGVSTGNLLTPDFKTVSLMLFELGIALAISAIGLVLIWIYKWRRIKKTGD